MAAYFPLHKASMTFMRSNLFPGVVSSTISPRTAWAIHVVNKYLYRFHQHTSVCFGELFLALQQTPPSPARIFHNRLRSFFSCDIEFFQRIVDGGWCAIEFRIFLKKCVRFFRHCLFKCFFVYFPTPCTFDCMFPAL